MRGKLVVRDESTFRFVLPTMCGRAGNQQSVNSVAWLPIRPQRERLPYFKLRILLIGQDQAGWPGTEAHPALSVTMVGGDSGLHLSRRNR